MNIAISGSTGFIGSRLSAYLRSEGYRIIPLPREYFASDAVGQLESAVAEADAVVNLAGAPIDRRWSASYKKVLRQSRIGVTHRLVEAVNRSPRPRVLVSASAVGRYPHVGCYDETDNQFDSGFLADLCREWEAEARRVKSDVRLAIMRFGIVLAPDGGAFARIRRAASLRMSAVAGNGWQPVSWIDREDLVRAIRFAIDNPSLSGAINATAPQRMTQKEFIHQIARRLHAPIVMPMPGALVRLLLGDAAQLYLRGQCAVPSRLTGAGFSYLSPDLAAFLDRALKPGAVRP